MKVLGIGLSRTGTSSLNKALRILGYRSIHFPRSLEQISELDAATDTPVAAAYKFLDEKYSGSKFIFTVRSDTGAWLDSCKALWDSEFKNWTENIHDLHDKLYDTKVYDREKLEIAYHRHFQEVNQYFENRTEDLLVMEVEELAWEPLCKFLGKRKPSKLFPHCNSRDRIGDDWDLNVDPINDA